MFSLSVCVGTLFCNSAFKSVISLLLWSIMPFIASTAVISFSIRLSSCPRSFPTMFCLLLSFSCAFVKSSTSITSSFSCGPESAVSPTGGIPPSAGGISAPISGVPSPIGGPCALSIEGCPPSCGIPPCPSFEGVIPPSIEGCMSWLPSMGGSCSPSG